MMELKDLDPTYSFMDQMNSGHEGPVTVFNTGVSPEGDPGDSLETWGVHAHLVKKCPGFISAQMYTGVCDSQVSTNVAVWESIDALRDAFSSPDFQKSLGDPKDGLVAYPLLMRKVAVPGICVA